MTKSKVQILKNNFKNEKFLNVLIDHLIESGLDRLDS